MEAFTTYSPNPSDILFADSFMLEDIETEEICFKKAIWSLQCAFGKKVAYYFKGQQFGANLFCDGEDMLVIMSLLKVLNSYDTRGMYLEEDVYNTITYSEIKALLRKTQKLL